MMNWLHSIATDTLGGIAWPAFEVTSWRFVAFLLGVLAMIVIVTGWLLGRFGRHALAAGASLLLAGLIAWLTGPAPKPAVELSAAPAAAAPQAEPDASPPPENTGDAISAKAASDAESADEPDDTAETDVTGAAIAALAQAIARVDWSEVEPTGPEPVKTLKEALARQAALQAELERVKKANTANEISRNNAQFILRSARSSSTPPGGATVEELEAILARWEGLLRTGQAREEAINRELRDLAIRIPELQFAEAMESGEWARPAEPPPPPPSRTTVRREPVVTTNAMCPRCGFATYLGEGMKGERYRCRRCSTIVFARQAWAVYAQRAGR